MTSPDIDGLITVVLTGCDQPAIGPYLPRAFTAEKMMPGAAWTNPDLPSAKKNRGENVPRPEDLAVKPTRQLVYR
jgi:hypothetical protein